MKKILLMGDSIRQGYDKYIKMMFEGVAEVYYPEANCRTTVYTIRDLLEWKNKVCFGEEVDLVHWNAGLWDDLVMLDGKHLVPIEYYKENIDRICVILKMLYPNAKMIFATSTPVQEHLFGALKRYNKDTKMYNAAASEIVKKHGGIVNDLYTLMSNAPVEYHSDLTHYYSKEGTRLLTNQVGQYIMEALGIKGKELDYDALFGEKENFQGM